MEFLCYTHKAPLHCGRYIKKGQFAIIDSLTEGTQIVLCRGLAFCILLHREHRPINNVMNYYDRREHFAGYDMLLNFMDAGRNKNMMP